MFSHNNTKISCIFRHFQCYARRRIKFIYIFGFLIFSGITASASPINKKVDNHYFVSSSSSIYDQKHHLTSYLGNVQMHHESEQLLGDKVVVYYNKINHHVLKLIADGHPAHYLQNDQNNNVVAQAQQIIYNPTNKSIVLINNATINKNEDVISGPKIWYDIAHDQIRTLPTQQKQQTVIVLQPQKPHS